MSFHSQNWEPISYSSCNLACRIYAKLKQWTGGLLWQCPSFTTSEPLSSLIFDTATINIHSRKDAPLRRLIRSTYSAGGRSVDFGLPVQRTKQADGFVEDINAFQTRFNNPPLAIKLINHPRKDALLPVLANMDIRRIWVTSAEGYWWRVGTDRQQQPNSSIRNTREHKMAV